MVIIKAPTLQDSWFQVWGIKVGNENMEATNLPFTVQVSGLIESSQNIRSKREYLMLGEGGVLLRGQEYTRAVLTASEARCLTTCW